MSSNLQQISHANPVRMQLFRYRGGGWTEREIVRLSAEDRENDSRRMSGPKHITVSGYTEKSQVFSALGYASDGSDASFDFTIMPADNV